MPHNCPWTRYFWENDPRCQGAKKRVSEAPRGLSVDFN